VARHAGGTAASTVITTPVANEAVSQFAGSDSPVIGSARPNPASSAASPRARPMPAITLAAAATAPSSADSGEHTGEHLAALGVQGAQQCQFADVVETGWTMTVTAVRLREAGASGVLPLALVTTS
jgi:hypothetical protein